MTIRYIRSTDGNNTDTGLTWALARATFQGMQNQDAAGDTIYVSQAHAETTAASAFWDWGGSTTAPVRVICANDSAEPPTSATVGATVQVTGVSSELQISGSHYCYGVNFICSGTGATNLWLHNGTNQAQLWEKCSFQISNATASFIKINGSTGSTGDVKWRNCDVKFGAAGSMIIPQRDKFTWEGGSVLAGGTSPSNLFELANAYSEVLVSGVDFSNLSTTFNFINTLGGVHFVVKNCTLPGSWTGDLTSATATYACRTEMYNCNGSGGTAIAMRIKDFPGIINDESTIVRAYGATDGISQYSWKMSANTQCNPEYGQLKTPPIAIWNDQTSATVTFSISILHDSVTALTNKDVWLEVEALTYSTGPQSSFTCSTNSANPIAAGVAVTSDSTTWVTTGITNANYQILQVSVVPMQRGPVYARVVMGKASYTLYADPKVQVS